MKRKLQHKNSSCCIEDMEALLDQIAEFRYLVKTTENVSDPAFLQEYRLFKQHIEWVSEDLMQNSSLHKPFVKSRLG